MIRLNEIYLIPVLISSLIILATSAVSAETLKQAWSQVVERNHRIKSAQARTSASEQQLHSTQGQRLPKLNISGGYTQLSETPTIKAQLGGVSTQFNTGQAGSSKVQAIATLPVFTSGRISHSIQAAKAALQATQQQEITTILEIKMQVAQTYITVLRTESAVELAQSHVAGLAAHEQDVTNLYAQGMVARNDLLAASVELANAQQRVVQVNNQLDVARSHYNQLLDRPLSATVELVLQFPPPP